MTSEKRSAERYDLLLKKVAITETSQRSLWEQKAVSFPTAIPVRL